MREADTGNPTPAERTAQLFYSDVFELANQLSSDNGAIISTLDKSRKIQIGRVEPFAKRRVGAKYSDMNHMQPGDLFNPPARAISQSLIVSQDEEGVGACVRVLRATYFDESTNAFVPELTIDGEDFKQREGDIAKYLRLNKKERSQLKFLDDFETLYVVKEEETLDVVAPTDANEQLERLLDNQ